MTLVTFRSDSDDSFYVSNVALFANSSVLNPFDSSMGSHVVGTVPMYDFQIWESVLAMLCRVFRLGAAELCHTAMLPPLLLLAASAAFSLGLSLLGNERRAYLFTFVLSVFYIFSGANGYSVGAFLLGRVWQGKAVSLTIVLPVLSALLLRELGRGERVQKRLWTLLLACMLVAISFNPTGLYVVGFEMLFLTAAVAIMEKRGRLMVHLLPPLAAGALFTFLIWLRTSRFPGQVDAASQAGRGFVLEQLQLMFAHQEVYLALFAVLFVAVLLRGGREARTYFVLTSVLLALFVWSPVLGRLVAQYATKTPSYWRVFWLIPVGPICAYSTVWLTEKLPRRWMHLAGVLVCSALLALPGEWMFTSAPAARRRFSPLRMWKRFRRRRSTSASCSRTAASAPLFSPASRSPQRCGRSGRSWSCSSPGRSTSSTSMSTAGRPKPAKICCGSGTLSTRVSRRQTASQRCWQNMAWNTSFSTGSAASRSTACCARAGTLPPGRTTMFS